MNNDDLNSNSIIPNMESSNNSQNSNIQSSIQNNNLNGNMAESSVSLQTINNLTSSVVNDTELLKAFIGKNYEKITTRSFNIVGFFFSSFYMFYRKMFLYAFLLFLVNLIILNVIKSYIVILVFNVLIGFFVNKIYLFYANRKINKIKLNNPQKSLNEVKEICIKKGGTSIGQIFLGLFIELVVSIIIFLVLILIGFASIFGNLFSEIGAKFTPNVKEITPNNDSNNINNVYNGMMEIDTSIKIADMFIITVPSIFQEGMFNDDNMYDYEYESNSDGVFDKCRFSLESVSGYSSAENLINQMKDYNVDNNPTSVTTSIINDISWYGFSYLDGFGQTYYFGTTKNSKVYLFKYEIQAQADTSCASYKEQVINSIKNK